MLEFKKCDITFSVTSNAIIATKFINNRLCKLFVETDGTTIDVTEKVLKMTKLSNELFESFDEIRRGDSDV